MSTVEVWELNRHQTSTHREHKICSNSLATEASFAAAARTGVKSAGMYNRAAAAATTAAADQSMTSASSTDARPLYEWRRNTNSVREYIHKLGLFVGSDLSMRCLIQSYAITREYTFMRSMVENKNDNACVTRKRMIIV